MSVPLLLPQLNMEVQIWWVILATLGGFSLCIWVFETYSPSSHSTRKEKRSHFGLLYAPFTTLLYFAGNGAGSLPSSHAGRYVNAPSLPVTWW